MSIGDACFKKKSKRFEVTKNDPESIASLRKNEKKIVKGANKGAGVVLINSG